MAKTPSTRRDRDFDSDSIVIPDPAWMIAHPGMKPRALDWVWAQRVGKRNAGGKSLMVAIALYGDPWSAAWVCGEAAICRAVGFKSRTYLETAIRKLTERNLVTAERLADKRWRLTMPGAPLGLEPDQPSDDAASGPAKWIEGGQS